MTLRNFQAGLDAVLKHEGGYVNHPKDPGGATNRGVTQAVYDSYRRRHGLSPRSVKGITELEIAEIYRRQYWDAVQGTFLPSGLDYAMFDFAVNSGPRRAIIFLQEIVAALPDGQLGPKTLAAVADRKANELIIELCDKRLAWLKGLNHWPTFGKGWERRVKEVKAAALKMA